MKMWCLYDIGRDSWDWVEPPAWERACFNSPEWSGGFSLVKTEPPQNVLWVGEWRLVGQGLHQTSFTYTMHPSQDTEVLLLFFGLLVFPLHVSQCLLSAFVVLITTYPELSRSSEMLQQSVLQETWNREHQLPQVFSDPLTKSDEQSRKLDECESWRVLLNSCVKDYRDCGAYLSCEFGWSR